MASYCISGAFGRGVEERTQEVPIEVSGYRETADRMGRQMMSEKGCAAHQQVDVSAYMSVSGGDGWCCQDGPREPMPSRRSCSYVPGMLGAVSM